MLKKLSFTAVIAALKERFEAAGLKTFDYVPENEPSPLIYVEATGKTPADTKTMFCEEYQIAAHIISPPGKGNTAVYQLIEQAEEALTEDVTLPEGFCLIYQMTDGVSAIYEEKTTEKHAVMPIRLKISYGYKIKI